MMITMEIFNCFLIVMSFLGLLVFVALYFVKAGYGVLVEIMGYIHSQ